MKLTFCGGAGAVTGANYLFESGATKILVDCGMHQGSSYCEGLNWEPFPYNPAEISAVIVTHPHLDHIGRLPQLIKAGFKGVIYSTPPAKDTGELILLDSQHVLQEEALKKHKPLLYTPAEVISTMGFWQKRKYHEVMNVGPFEISFVNAGHVLGSASAIIKIEGKTIVCSGDLGNNPPPFICGTEYPVEADYALIESAYGNRVHEDAPTRHELFAHIIQETIKKGGVLMIPSFALERTQEMIFELNDLIEQNKIPRVPVFIDSPLAIKLTAVYQKYASDPLYFSEESIQLIRGGDAIFDFPGLHMTLTTEQSKAINEIPAPKIVIAGSGMSQAGRILHHERRYLPDPKSTLLVMGYQAQGSLGRRLLEGAPLVRIMGEEMPVAAQIASIGGYSAHADKPQLLKWVDHIHKNLKQLFVVQGEGEDAEAFAGHVCDRYHSIQARVPRAGETVVL